MIKKQGSPLDLNMVEILHMKCAQASASSQCFAAMPLSAVGLSPSGSMQHGQGNSQCIDDICCRRCQQDLCCCSRREFFHGVLLRSCFLFGLCIVNHSGLEAAGLATCNSAVTIVLSFGSVFFSCQEQAHNGDPAHQGPRFGPRRPTSGWLPSLWRS